MGHPVIAENLAKIYHAERLKEADAERRSWQSKGNKPGWRQSAGAFLIAAGQKVQARSAAPALGLK